jgi:hypothetical protein
MSTENIPSAPSGVSVTFTSDSYAAIAAEANRLGLPVDAYLVALNAVQAGRVTTETLEIAGRVFVRDHEILRELAK